MSAYVVLDITVKDPELFEQYKLLAPSAIAEYGGKYLTRGGDVEVLEGQCSPNRIVILEFESKNRAKIWLNSSEYSEALKMRRQAADSDVFVVEGV